MKNLKKNLILIELNEVNFDIVEKYLCCEPQIFPSLRKLFECTRIYTTAEQKYNELEPWIQWVSVHTAKTFNEHGVFRLGDIVNSEIPQIFEQLENAGYSIGVLSAINTANRLKHPAYFIPDPWTETTPDLTWWSRVITSSIKQVVNDNAQAKVTLKSAFWLTVAFLKFGRLSHFKKYVLLIWTSFFKRWTRALLLDLLLHDIHWKLFNTNKPDFSTLFLNAGAHIQHHYFFNSKPLHCSANINNPTWYINSSEDPIYDMLLLYDFIIGEYFSREDIEVILATGLSQVPYDRVKFYYRLNSHNNFLQKIKISFKSVLPRMTRDFLIEFHSEQQALDAERILSSIYIKEDGERLFGEIDNRLTSLFVTLTYSREVTDSTIFCLEGQEINLLSEVSFVALKNGMHSDKGFAFFTPRIALHAPSNMSHVREIGKAIISYFEMRC